MAESSEISWTDNTHNEWIGCTRVSPGCQHCYAETLMDTRYGRVKWGKGQPRALTSEANRRKPLAWDRAAAKAGKRTRVFSASLSDWLDHEVPAEFLAGLLATVARTPHLDWLLLSKRPHLWRERLEAAAPKCEAEAFVRGWLDGHAPGNVWVGTTVEDQQRADERVPHLLAIPARVRFLSCEPLLGPVDLERWLSVTDSNGEPSGPRCKPDGSSAIDWVIAGGESGHGARPMHPEWARSLRDQAQAAGVAFHMKQWGEHLPVCPVYPEPGVDVDEEGCDLDPPSLLDGYPEPIVLYRDGHQHDIDRDGQPTDDGAHYMVRVGKKAAGRMLDGREWNEFPLAAEQRRSETP